MNLFANDTSLEDSAWVDSSGFPEKFVPDIPPTSTFITKL